MRMEYNNMNNITGSPQARGCMLVLELSLLLWRNGTSAVLSGHRGKCQAKSVDCRRYRGSCVSEKRMRSRQDADADADNDSRLSPRAAIKCFISMYSKQTKAEEVEVGAGEARTKKC